MDSLASICFSVDCDFLICFFNTLLPLWAYDCYFCWAWAVFLSVPRVSWAQFSSSSLLNGSLSSERPSSVWSLLPEVRVFRNFSRSVNLKGRTSGVIGLLSLSSDDLWVELRYWLVSYSLRLVLTSCAPFVSSALSVVLVSTTLNVYTPNRP